MLQVVNEFKAFRLEACKHGSHFRNNPGEFWAMLLDQKAAGMDDVADAPSKFDNMFRLHLISQLIPTASTDVERAFSYHKRILGTTRTRLHVKNIDSRLRGVEQVRPLIQQYGYKWAGQPENTSPDLLHPYQLYYNLAEEEKLNEFLSIKMHCALAPENSKTWLDLYLAEFEGVTGEGGVDCCDEEGVEQQQGVSVSLEEVSEEVARLTRLLAGET